MTILLPRAMAERLREQACKLEDLRLEDLRPIEIRPVDPQELVEGIHRILEAAGETDHLYPETRWAPAAKEMVKRLKPELLKLFRKQANEYASRIPDNAGKVREAGDELSWIEAEVLADDKTWEAELRKIITPYTAKAVEAGDRVTAAEFDFEETFDLDNAEVQKIVRDRVIPFAKEVQETTHDAVRNALSKAVDEGEGIYQMRERIEGLPEFDEYRAEMVARTETVSAMNTGEFKAYHDMGAVGKKWIASGDSRTRDAHRRAHGQVKELDKPFRVGGENLQHPGEGSAANRVNCRCAVAPIFDAERMEKEKAEYNPRSPKKWNADVERAKAKQEARRARQRQRQEEYQKKQGGKHADKKLAKAGEKPATKKAAQTGGTSGHPAAPQERVEAARQMVGHSIEEAEPVLAQIPHIECGYIAHPNGEIFEFVEGGHGRLPLTPDVYSHLEGNVFTHNHHTPVEEGGVGTFSEDDVAVACEAQVREMRVVTIDGKRYVMKPPPSGWDADFYEDFVEPMRLSVAPQAEQELLLMVQSGEIMNIEEAQDWLENRIWELVSQWTSVSYETGTL